MVNQTTIMAIAEWARGRGVPTDLENMADELGAMLLGGPIVAPPGAASAVPGPHLGVDTGGEHLHDAACLLLKRFLSPATESDPAVLSALLDLVGELRLGGARELVAGLLFGGMYAQDGPKGSLEAQLLRTLNRCGGDSAPMLKLLGDLDEPAEPGDETQEATESPGQQDELLRGDQVPQVNDPNQVFAFLDAVGEGIGDRRAYARFARVSVRQADFIARAAASLGLVDVVSGGVYELTETGKSLPPSEDPSGQVARHRIVGRHPLIRALALDGSDGLPEVPELEQLLSARTHLGAGTIRRRAQALRRWVEWWGAGGK